LLNLAVGEFSAQQTEKSESHSLYGPVLMNFIRRWCDLSASGGLYGVIAGYSGSDGASKIPRLLVELEMVALEA
jgi:hypothetical protein